MSDFYSKLKSEFNFPRGIVSPANDRLNNFLKKYIPFNTLFFKSGEKADSWTVPNAWELNSSELTVNEKIKSIKIINFIILIYLILSAIYINI